MTHGRTAGRGTNAPSEAGEPSVDRAGPAYRPADTSARRRCHLLHRPPSAGSGSAPSRRCGETEELAGESVMVDYLFIYLVWCLGLLTLRRHTASLTHVPSCAMRVLMRFPVFIFGGGGWGRAATVSQVTSMIVAFSGDQQPQRHSHSRGYMPPVWTFLLGGE